MNTAKHPQTPETARTPGPWLAAKLTRRGHGGSYYWHITHGPTQEARENEDCVVALVPDDCAGRNEADTQLIASAPDLLAALAQLVNLHDGAEDGGYGPTPDDWACARALIARAEGRVT